MKMKKLVFVIAIFAAMFLMICCGDDDGVVSECQMKDHDVFMCGENETVMRCEDGTWVKYRQCSSGQTCNYETGNCDPADNGENNDDNGNNNNNNEQPATQCGNNKTDEGEACDGDAVECKTLDATLLGYAKCKADCSGYDTSSCKSGGNGGGGNGGGTTGGSCADIMNCFLPANQAQDQAGMQACVDAGSQEGQQAFNTWYSCVYQNQCQQVNCQQCLNEYNTCMNGGNGGGGNGGGGATNTNCYATYQCWAQCQDTACEDTCMNNASDNGKTQATALINCFESNSCFNVSSQEEFNQCVNTNCSNEINNCEGVQ